MAKIRFFIGIMVSLLFLYLALENVDIRVVAASFRNIDFRYLALCIVCQFASLFCRSYLWKNILSFEKDVRYRHSFEALLIGYMGNNVLPFRMGEAMRAYAMGKKEGISRTLSFASIILERLIDLFTLLLFFLTLVLLMKLEEWIILSGIVVFAFLILAILFLYAVASDFLSLLGLLKFLVVCAQVGIQDAFRPVQHHFAPVLDPENAAAHLRYRRQVVGNE